MDKPFNFDAPYGAQIITTEQESFSFDSFVLKFRREEIEEVLEGLEKHDCRGIFLLNACYYKDHLDVVKFLLETPEVGTFNRKEFALSYLCAKERENNEVMAYFKEKFPDKVFGM